MMHICFRIADTRTDRRSPSWRHQRFDVRRSRVADACDRIGLAYNGVVVFTSDRVVRRRCHHGRRRNRHDRRRCHPGSWAGLR